MTFTGRQKLLGNHWPKSAKNFPPARFIDYSLYFFVGPAAIHQLACTPFLVSLTTSLIYVPITLIEYYCSTLQSSTCITYQNNLNRLFSALQQNGGIRYAGSQLHIAFKILLKVREYALPAVENSMFAMAGLPYTIVTWKPTRANTKWHPGRIGSSEDFSPTYALIVCATRNHNSRDCAMDTFSLLSTSSFIGFTRRASIDFLCGLLSWSSFEFK